jgi:hypothetical protein
MWGYQGVKINRTTSLITGLGKNEGGDSQTVQNKRYAIQIFVTSTEETKRY